VSPGPGACCFASYDIHAMRWYLDCMPGWKSRTANNIIASLPARFMWYIVTSLSTWHSRWSASAAKPFRVRKVATFHYWAPQAVALWQGVAEEGKRQLSLATFFLPTKNSLSNRFLSENFFSWKMGLEISILRDFNFRSNITILSTHRA